MPSIFFSFRTFLSKAFFAGACAFFSLGFLSDLARATSFSQRTRLELSGGYNFGQHTISHYYYPSTVRLIPRRSSTRETGERGGLRSRGAAFGSRTQASRGLYLRSVPAVVGGGSFLGNLSDKDFCDSSQEEVTIYEVWTCPQQLTVWSDTDSPVRNWFVGAELDNAAGFFLQNPDNDERFFRRRTFFRLQLFTRERLGTRSDIQYLSSSRPRRQPSARCFIRGGAGCHRQQDFLARAEGRRGDMDRADSVALASSPSSSSLRFITCPMPLLGEKTRTS